MTVNPTSTSGCANSAASQQAGFKQTKADFSALSTALQNGDLSGAQTAFAQLQKDSPRLAQALSSSAPSSTDSSSSGSSRLSDLQSLGSALQSGDLSGAQAALAKVQQDGSATKTGGHGHHHHGAPPASTDDTSTTSSSTTTPAGSGPGSILNTTA